MERPTDSSEFLPEDVYEEYIRSSEYLKNIEEIVKEIDDGEKLEYIVHEVLEDIDWDEVENPDTLANPFLGADDCSVEFGMQYLDKHGVHTTYLHLYRHNGKDYEDFDVLPPTDHTFSTYAVSPPKSDDLTQPKNHNGSHVLHVPMPDIDSMLQKPFIVHTDVYRRVVLNSRWVTDSLDEEHYYAAKIIVREGLATYLSADEISKISKINRTIANNILHDALLESGQL